MTRKNETVTSISLAINLLDEYDKEIFDHVMKKGSRKKSGYLKRLIYNDMMGIGKREMTITTHEIEDEEMDEEAMKGFF